MPSHENHTRRILDEIGTGQSLSQRSLSRELGIALGLTNLILKKVVTKGWVRATAVKPNRVKYFLTPSGFAEKARMSRNALQNSVRFYCDARDRIRESLAALTADWPAADGPAPRRIIFYGTGEVAEIGFVCLQETDLQLVGAIDDLGKGRFFNVPVFHLDDLSAGGVNGVPFDRIVVMTFGKPETLRVALEARGIAFNQVFWV